MLTKQPDFPINFRNDGGLAWFIAQADGILLLAEWVENSLSTHLHMFLSS